jgi:diguanylate cyclase (GGDEF)-like protein
MLASWTEPGAELSVAWTSHSLIGQAFDARGALLDPAACDDGGLGISAVAAPVRCQPEWLGAIYAGFSPPTAMAAEELEWSIDSYARLAALCVTGQSGLGAALASVGSDPLTGCLTYAAVVEVLKSEVQRSMRSGHRLSCCFVDLDGFKQVNDRRGHLEGNHVLTGVGEALTRTARAYDVVGRFGGDEFVIVLPETDAVETAAIGRRFRAASLAAIAAATPVPVDVSIGIAEWDGECSGTALLGAADKALAEAKASGGGRIRTRPAAAQVGGLLERVRKLLQRRPAR